MGHNQPPLNRAYSLAVLMVGLWRKWVSLRNCYFVTASMATVYSGPRCGPAWFDQLVECFSDTGS